MIEAYSGTATGGRATPRILLFAPAGADGAAIAAILAEARIAVTAVDDEDAALRAADTESFNLAIVTAPSGMVEGAAGDDAAALKRLRAAHPGLEILAVGETAIGRRHDAGAGLDARRFVGCVRERLAGRLDAGAAAQARETAEFAIAEARLRCLHHRAETARGSTACDLAREIDAAIARREALRRPAPKLAP